MFFWRKVKESNSIVSKLVYQIILRIFGTRYGFQIALEAKIDGGLFIGHFGPVVISALASIGHNCNIAHNVTIGATRRKKNFGAPQIGNNVWIGTGAVLVGKIAIGNNVLIAPNSFVNFDVPSNSIVIGNPAKVISSMTATSEYINNQAILS